MKDSAFVFCTSHSNNGLKTIYKNKNIMKVLIEVNRKPEEPKGKLKKKFALLNEDDLLSSEGKQEELLGRLQIKLGKTKEEIFRIIYDL